MKAMFDVPAVQKRVSGETKCGICPCRKRKTPAKWTTKGRKHRGIMVITGTALPCEAAHGLWNVADDFSSRVLGDVKNAMIDGGVHPRGDTIRVVVAKCDTAGYAPEDVGAACDCCSPRIRAVVEEEKPKVIVVMGSAGLSALYGSRTTRFTMDENAWEDNVIPDHELGAWVIPTYGWRELYNQTQIDRKTKERKRKPIYSLYIRAITKAFRRASRYERKDCPRDNLARAKSLVRVTEDVGEAVAWLGGIRDGDVISIDYENSGIKPEMPGHFLKTLAVYSQNRGEALSFMVDTRRKEYAPVRKEVRRVLRNGNILKVGHNIKYEERWTRKFLNVRIDGWIWDTMLSTHAKYNGKKGINSLKFQTLVNFGVPCYTNAVENAFKEIIPETRGMGANSISGIDNAPLDAMMEYNALDTVFTFWLYKKHRKYFEKLVSTLADKGGKTHMEGLAFLRESALMFTDMETNGICIDLKYLREGERKCDDGMAKAEAKFRQTEVYRLWRQNFPKPKITSGKELSHILYGVMGLAQDKKTDKGDDSTDKEALLSLGLSDLVPLNDYFQLNKTKGTFIAQLKREVVSEAGADRGMLYPSFNLHTTKTHRSSSADPNQQNVPVRNEAVAEIIRGAYIPREGVDGALRQLFEADLKGAEVSVAACYNGDPNFTKYVSDPANDMHKDIMAVIMKCDRDQVTKKMRQLGKNKFVFPQFYGDFYKPCAKAIWNAAASLEMDDGTPLYQWMHEHDIARLPKGWRGGTAIPVKDIDDENAPWAPFVTQMQNVEDHMWNEMFPVYTAWKNETWERYLTDGFLDSFTGFRYTNMLDKKRAINWLIQGTAYHLNQEGLNEINRRLRELEYQTVIVNQVHDSGLYDTTQEERDAVIRGIHRMMNVMLPHRYSWITVPIVIEFDVCAPGDPWFKKKPMDVSGIVNNKTAGKAGGLRPLFK